MCWLEGAHAACCQPTSAHFSPLQPTTAHYSPLQPSHPPSTCLCLWPAPSLCACTPLNAPARVYNENRGEQHGVWAGKRSRQKGADAKFEDGLCPIEPIWTGIRNMQLCHSLERYEAVCAMTTHRHSTWQCSAQTPQTAASPSPAANYNSGKPSMQV